MQSQAFPAKYKKSFFLIKNGLLTQQRYDSMIRRYLFSDKEKLIGDLTEQIHFVSSRPISLKLINDTQVTGAPNIYIENRGELDNFIATIDSLFKSYREIWLIQTKQKPHCVGRIILDFALHNRLLEVSYGSNAKVLNKFEPSAPYVRYESLPFLESLHIVAAKNNDEWFMKEVNIVLNRLTNFHRLFKDLEILLTANNIDYIALQFELSEEKQLIIYDWDGNYDKIIAVLDRLYLGRQGGE